MSSEQKETRTQVDKAIINNYPKEDEHGNVRGKLTSVTIDEKDWVVCAIEIEGVRGPITEGSECSFKAHMAISNQKSPDGGYRGYPTILINCRIINSSQLRTGEFKEEDVFQQLETMIGKVFTFKFRSFFSFKNPLGQWHKTTDRKEAEKWTANPGTTRVIDLSTFKPVN
jgi:hypothetical protein